MDYREPTDKDLEVYNEAIRNGIMKNLKYFESIDGYETRLLYNLGTENQTLFVQDYIDRLHREIMKKCTYI